jgi:hypothetical protein
MRKRIVQWLLFALLPATIGSANTEPLPPFMVSPYPWGEFLALDIPIPARYQLRDMQLSAHDQDREFVMCADTELRDDTAFVRVVFPSPAKWSSTKVMAWSTNGVWLCPTGTTQIHTHPWRAGPSRTDCESLVLRKSKFDLVVISDDTSKVELFAFRSCTGREEDYKK